jgi:hypothetical protein
VSFGQIFAYCNLFVLPAWALLIFLPTWRWTRMIAAYITPSVIAVLYLVLMLSHLTPKGGGFGSLDQVAGMYQNPALLLAGWLHYLAVDLFIGAWEVRDAQRLGIPHLFVVPCLAVTLLAGPVGLLLYLGMRAAKVRRWPGIEPVHPERWDGIHDRRRQAPTQPTSMLPAVTEAARRRRRPADTKH